MNNTSKETANLFLRNAINDQLSKIDYDSKKLFKVFVETSTRNEYSGSFYEGFIKFKELDMLSSDEKEIVEVLLEYYEASNGFFPDITYLKGNGFKPLREYEYADKRFQYIFCYPIVVTIIIEQFIQLRQTETFIDKNSSVITNMAKRKSMPLNFVYDLEDFRNSNHPFNVDKISLSFNYDVENAKNYLSTGLNFLDVYAALKEGTVNCLIKNKYADNFFEIVLIYNAVIKNHKNVCFVCTTWSKEDIINKIIAIHSYTLNESLHIKYSDLVNRNVDKKIIDTVLKDFENKAGNHLIIFDNNAFKIFNPDTFRKLIMETRFKFNHTNKRSIELLVVDKIEDLRLEHNGEIEDSISKIIKIYSNFIIRQSSKLCYREGFEEMTTLFSTNTCKKSTYSWFRNNGLNEEYNQGIEIINSILEKYSDNVIALSFAKDTKDNANGIIQVLKSSYNVPMNEPIKISIDLKNCKICKEDIPEHQEKLDSIEEVLSSEEKVNLENIDELFKTFQGDNSQNQ